jgi:hypothetical protein
MPVTAESQTTEIYTHLLAVISSDKFLKMQGLGNEIPFFICPFNSTKADKIYKEVITPLVNQLAGRGVRVLRVDLYDLSIEILKERGIWEQTLQSEKEISKEELKDLLQSVLDPEHHLIPAIAKRMQETDFDVMFLTGVGEVFPYIRSHTVLNNLQSAAKEKPTIMFFPGEYSQSVEKGSSLNLFGRLLDDNYYRAFNIYKYF